MNDRNSILFVYERNITTVELMQNSFSSMMQESKTVITFKKFMMIQPRDIDMADVLVMIRPHNYLSFKIAKKARQAGCFVCFLMDDDMFHLPKSIHSIPWRMQALKKTLELSDALITSNPNILNRYKKYTVLKKGIVSHTPVTKDEEEKIPRIKEDKSKVKLVYAAGGHHSSSINNYIVPILNYLNKYYSGEISMTFIGVKPEFDFKSYKFEIEYVEPMMLKEYREWMLAHHYDVGFAPLENTPFNNDKYFNKFFEYTLTGVVGIYSNCQPYTFVVRNGFNGLLANDNADDWIDKTMSVINNQSLREFIFENAASELSKQFNEKKLLKTLEYNLHELFEKRKKTRFCTALWFDKLIYGVFLVLDSLYLVGFYLKKVGIYGVIRKTVVHYRWIKMCKKNNV